MARGLIVYSLSCTSVRVGGWEDCWIGVHRPNSCDRVPSTLSISTYSSPSVHHADGIPVWLLIVGASYILHEDVIISRTLRPSEESSVQEGVAFATLHRLRQRSRNICRLDKRPAHLQHYIICYANGVHYITCDMLPATRASADAWFLMENMGLLFKGPPYLCGEEGGQYEKARGAWTPGCW